MSTYREVHGDAALAVLLPTIPARGFGDGYDWMDGLNATPWASIAVWGRDGWDMGQWPYVIVATCNALGEKVEGEPRARAYGVLTYVEGDVDIYVFNDHADRIAKLDEIAQWYWRRSNDVPQAVEIGPLEPELFGSFSWARCDAEPTAYPREWKKLEQA